MTTFQSPIHDPAYWTAERTAEESVRITALNQATNEALAASAQLAASVTRMRDEGHARDQTIGRAIDLPDWIVRIIMVQCRNASRTKGSSRKSPTA
jgi:hypothetical protein